MSRIRAATFSSIAYSPFSVSVWQVHKQKRPPGLPGGLVGAFWVFANQVQVLRALLPPAFVRVKPKNENAKKP